MLGAAGFMFSISGLEEVLLVCGIAAIVWGTVPETLSPTRQESELIITVVRTVSHDPRLRCNDRIFLCRLF
jgi:hypothetical protein